LLDADLIAPFLNNLGTGLADRPYRIHFSSIARPEPRSYFFPCQNPKLVDDDPFEGWVCVTDDVFSYTTVQGSPRTVRVLRLATDSDTEAEVSALQARQVHAQQVASDEALNIPNQVGWITDQYGRTHMIMFSRAIKDLFAQNKVAAAEEERSHAAALARAKSTSSETPGRRIQEQINEEVIGLRRIASKFGLPPAVRSAE
jgi:hypothetical protein